MTFGVSSNNSYDNKFVSNPSVSCDQGHLSGVSTSSAAAVSRNNQQWTPIRSIPNNSTSLNNAVDKNERMIKCIEQQDVQGIRDLFKNGLKYDKNISHFIIKSVESNNPEVVKAVLSNGFDLSANPKLNNCDVKKMCEAVISAVPKEKGALFKAFVESINDLKNSPNKHVLVDAVFSVGKAHHFSGLYRAKNFQGELPPVDLIVEKTKNNIDLFIGIFQSRKSNINIIQPNGNTLLCDVLSCGNIEQLNAVLSLGADPNAAIDERGNLPLALAVINKEIQQIETLVSAGANLAERQPLGRTLLPLQDYFVKKDDPEMAKTIVEAKLLPFNNAIFNSILLNDGFALLKAYMKKYPLVNNLVHKMLQENSNVVTQAIKRGHLGLLRLYVDTGINYDLADDNGYKPTHVAAMLGRNGIVRSFAEADPDSLNVLTSRARHPLDLALDKGHNLCAHLIFLNDAYDPSTLAGSFKKLEKSICSGTGYHREVFQKLRNYGMC